MGFGTMGFGTKRQDFECTGLIRLKELLTPLTTGVGEDVGKKEPSYTAGGNVN
jgi:hypothetical protein